MKRYADKPYKRLFDLTILAAAHLFPLLLSVWVLLWVLIPLVIWLEDRGPVFYRQRRVGRGGEVFTVLKFRSMRQDAESITGPVWAAACDPRITRVGRLLRRTALDELPQVINILKGDMSFVGPRPERPELHEKFVEVLPGFQRRLQVRPGLTGLAQTKGDYNLPPDDKLRYDLEYINRMSPLFDAKLVGLSALNTVLARWDQRSGKPASRAIDGEIRGTGETH